MTTWMGSKWLALLLPALFDKRVIFTTSPLLWVYLSVFKVNWVGAILCKEGATSILEISIFWA